MACVIRADYGANYKNHLASPHLRSFIFNL